VVLAPRRRGRSLARAVRDDGPVTPATVLLASAGLGGVLAGSTLDGGVGTAVMAVSALVPSAVLAGALARTRTALAHEGRQRHRLAGEVAVSDEQLRRLADRVGRLSDQGVDDAAELERTRLQLRRARVELAGAKAVLAGVREDAARALGAADAARAARDEARARVERAVAEAEAAARAAAEADALVRSAVPEPAGWRPALRVDGQRSFASVDLRVFDAFTEADLADEDAVLDAPVRRGRHVAPLDTEAAAPTAPTVRAGAQTAGVASVTGIRREVA
jgi:hypothetical protein